MEKKPFQDRASLLADVAEMYYLEEKNQAAIAKTIGVTRSMVSFEELFFRLAIPYRSVGTVRFYAREEVKDAIAWLASYLKNFASATERLYLTAVSGFYEYVAAERLAVINLPRLRLLIRQRARRPGIRLPQFPAEDIERVIAFMSDPASADPSRRGC